MNDPAKKIAQMVTDLVERKFWGKLEFAFRDGEITFVRREETVRFDPPPLDAKGLDKKREA